MSFNEIKLLSLNQSKDNLENDNTVDNKYQFVVNKLLHVVNNKLKDHFHQIIIYPMKIIILYQFDQQV